MEGFVIKILVLIFFIISSSKKITASLRIAAIQKLELIFLVLLYLHEGFKNGIIFSRMTI